MLPAPGVTLISQPFADSHGPIPLHVTMVADMPTYYANHGILDDALQIVLVRRDGPGVRLLYKIDPDALMLAPTPLQPRSDPELDSSRVREQHTYDPKDFDVPHDGAGKYFVFASFATWRTDPEPLTVRHPRHSLPFEPCPRAPVIEAALQATLPPVPIQRDIIARVHEHRPLIEGSFRAQIERSMYRDDPTPPPFVTIVAVRLAATGGAIARSFIVDAATEGPDYAGQFAIPLAMVGPLEPGTYDVLVFAGHEQAPPLAVTIA